MQYAALLTISQVIAFIGIVGGLILAVAGLVRAEKHGSEGVAMIVAGLVVAAGSFVEAALVELAVNVARDIRAMRERLEAPR